MSSVSMTGYGRASASVAGFRAEAEVSTVNRKQFDCSVSLPSGLSALEEDCRKAVRARLSRGRAQVSVRVAADAAPDSAAARRHVPAVDSAVAALRALADAAGVPFAPTLSDLLLVPGLAEAAAAVPDPDAARPAVAAALAAALDSLDAMREKEGAALRADLERRLDRIDAVRNDIAALAPLVPVAHREALRRRVAALGAPLQPDDPVLAREIAVFADKCDISEELVRLAAHVAHARALLAAPEPAGRKLDFLSQEMNRECNTIGSKSPDSGIARAVVDAKALVETFREQVQNLE